MIGSVPYLKNGSVGFPGLRRGRGAQEHDMTIGLNGNRLRIWQDIRFSIHGVHVIDERFFL